MQQHEGDEAEDITPRSDLWQGLGWVVFGVAVLVASVSMDRLQSQNINPYTVPGLLPGMLGIAMILLGGVLAVRSWRRGALAHPREPFTEHQREVRKRVWTVIALCVVYSVVLVGRGLPFWLASAIFITGSILILQRMDRDPEARRLTPRVIGKAVLIGVLAAVITQVAFQDLFLVRLP
ncbi:tripartite tricarboxylate transporter TctB family protein [Ramlibacter albus]|uniref:Tripartite tricarboxylate transporter TctB family protein n=1 Tax=Ramlibacter albus TaxID=2079448 RepID=A0A923S249_9BURK|nr:tripartite tricarboxylate transporter TctB family protein [Ramlibacter albus]MBC5764990.1 tripartite tricarboxylate transporter TctB family protein [Ramlibacter albus]